MQHSITKIISLYIHMAHIQQIYGQSQSLEVSQLIGAFTPKWLEHLLFTSLGLPNLTWLMWKD